MHVNSSCGEALLEAEQMRCWKCDGWMYLIDRRQHMTEDTHALLATEFLWGCDCGGRIHEEVPACQD